MHTTPAVLYCIGVGGRISPDVQSLNFYCSRIIVTRETEYYLNFFPYVLKSQKKKKKRESLEGSDEE